ncbi:MAG: CoA pyrophosphatase [Rhodospirillaceae bacterium]|nr:CoA pyrophosphatase [Rhodospirillaceae bacterium]
MNRPFIAGILAGSLPRLRDPLNPEAAISRRQSRLRGDHIVDSNVRIPAELRDAAVLVPLIDHPGGMGILLTQRTAGLPRHAGQVAFPGGRLDATDRDPVHTALRETEEEIGLPPGNVAVAGRLDDYITGTGYVVAPIVGFVEPGQDYVPQPSEVEDVFEVPLSFFMDPANHKRETKRWNGIDRTFYAMHWNGRYIWGATAAMLVNLYEVLTHKAAA